MLGEKEEEVGECGQAPQRDFPAQLLRSKSLGQGSVNVLYKGQNSESFRLCGPSGAVTAAWSVQAALDSGSVNGCGRAPTELLTPRVVG